MIRQTMLLCVSAALGLILLAAQADANVISNFTTIFGTDFDTAGTGGLRTIPGGSVPGGTGAITVTGVTGPVTQSYLWWHGPTNTANPNANANVNVNGTALTGANIGFSDNNFWGYDNSQAYRANSTTVITGNGVYNLSNFSKPPSIESNGAGTALFFNDGNTANNRDVVIFNGNDSNFASAFDPAGWNLSLNGINYTSGVARLTLFVSDGQNFGPADDGTLRLNGVPLATGGIFQGKTLPGGAGPTGNGNLFDIVSYDITNFLAPGLNNLNLILDPGFDDAVSAVAAFIDLPAGAAPPPQVIPEPASMALLGTGLAGLLAARRIRKA